MNQEEVRAASLDLLTRAGVALTPDEVEAMEIVDFGLGHIEVEGLQLVVYINTERYCGKELVLLPGQTCAEHRHPPIGQDPGKMETFRCRWGEVSLYVEGGSADSVRPDVPAGSEAYYTVFKEVRLLPGEQYTILPDTLHWFRAGNEGAVVTEFSSTSRDASDVFTDPRVRRVA